MASPVDTSVKFIRSTMPGAPSLTRAAGSMIALLDAFLVNGWGSQTASSVVVSGGVATATFPADHAAAKHSVVLVAGVTGAMTDLNGEQKVTAVAPNVVQWATALANGTATGTITVKMAGAGWNKPFSGTNLAVYKSASAQGHGQFFRFADTAVEAARIIGYENMTAISTGTGLFPSAAQFSGGFYVGKSDETSGTNASPYSIFSDGRLVYIMTQPSYHSSVVQARSVGLTIFGDMIPESPAGDPYATICAGAPEATWFNVGSTYVLDYASTNYAVACPRDRSGAGTSSRGCLLNVGNTLGSASLPNPVSGAPYLSINVYRDTTSDYPRARLPGLLHGVNSYAELILDSLSICEVYGGKAYLVNYGNNGTNNSSGSRLVLVDITGPWR